MPNSTLSDWLRGFFGTPAFSSLEPSGPNLTVPAVSLPPGPPIVAPEAPQVPANALLDGVAAIILAKNWTYSYDSDGVYPFLSKGGAIHKIDKPTSEAIAKVIIDNADGGLTVPYLMACIAEESLFDPACENGNYSYVGHVGSNPTKSPDGFDVGIAQLKLKFLMDDKKFDVTAAAVFAKDITKAIPYMATTMKLLLGYADALIQDTKPRTDTPLGMMNRYSIATGAYNFGRTGMKQLVTSATTLPSHCVTIMSYEKQYAKQLNLKSVFQDTEG
jgi:hypothetical protein